MPWGGTLSECRVVHFPTAGAIFRDLTVDVVREGSFTSTRQLAAAIMEYLSDRNLSPRRYVWKKSGAEILASIQRARLALSKQPSS